MVSGRSIDPLAESARDGVVITINFILPMPTPGAVFGMIVFSAVGLAAFLYGKRLAQPRPIILGVLLMIYPYFVSDPWPLYGIGALLTAGLFFPRAS